MSYTPEVQNFTSILNSTNIPLGAGETFQGVSENVEKWGTVSVSVFTPFGESTSGTLYFEVSRDGVNFGGPSRVFTDTSVAQPHMWTIAEKYFRIKYVNDTATATIFNLQTQYSVNRPLVLGHQINETLIDEYESTIVKSVGVGKDVEGNYVNTREDGYAFRTVTLLGENATYNSAIFELSPGYSQVQTHMRASHDGTYNFYWYSDSAGNDLIRTLSGAYTASDGFILLSAPAFAAYTKYSFTNGATAQTDFYYDTKFLTKSISGQILNLNAGIGSGMVANLGRNVIVGQDPIGTFKNDKVDGYKFITTTNLLSGLTYNSGILSTDGYAQIQIEVNSDVNGSVLYNWYGDVSGTIPIRSVTRPYTTGDYEYISVPVLGPYLSIIYTNGSSNQTSFYYGLKFLTHAISGQIVGVNDLIANTTIANVNRSITVGQDPLGVFTNEKVDGYIATTTTTLGSGITYNTGILNTEGFAQATVEIHANVAGTLQTIWYADLLGTNIVRTTTREYNGVKVDQYEYVSSPIYGPYYRVTYTNSNTAQTSFYLGVKFSTHAISGQIVGINDEISSNVIANISRSVLVGENKTSGVFDNIGITQGGNLPVEIKAPTSAFGDIRMQTPTPQCQIDFVYGLNINTTITGGTGIGSTSAVTNNPVIALSTGAQTNSSAILYSRRYMKYRPGQGGLCRITNIFASGTTGSLQLMGIGDDVNGYFFAYSGATFGIIHRKNSVDTFTPQSSWNGDVCDGSRSIYNKSGMNLIPQYGNVYEIAMTYLGYGNVTFSILNPNDGWFVAHILKYPNQNTTTLVTNPSLPLYWYVANTTNNTNLTMYPTCGALFSEGMEKMTGPKYAWDGAKTVATVTVTPLYSIRNNSTFKGYVNKAQIRIKSISYAYDSTTTQLATGTLQLIRGATLTGGVFGDIDSNNSITAINTGATATLGGVVIFNMNNAKNNTNIIDVSDLDIFLSPGEVLTLATKNSTAQSSNVSVAVNWVEDL